MEGARQTLAAAAAERPKTRNLGSIRRMLAYLRPYRLRVAGALVALTLAAAAVLSVGLGLRYLVDNGFAAGETGALDHALRAMIVIVLVLAVATFARTYLVTWLGERVVADLRRDLYAHVIRLSPGFFEVTRTGEVISRLTTDTAVIQAVIGSSVTQALRNLLLLVGGLSLLVITNPKLTAIVLIVVPLVVLPIIVIGRHVRRLSRLAQDKVAGVSGQGEETLNAIRTVQAFAQEEREGRNFAQSCEAAFVAATNHAFARAGLGGIVIGFVFGAIVVILWIGGQDVLAGRITAGDLASFVFFASTVAGAVGGLADIFGDIQRAAGASERLFELLDTEPEIAAPAAPRPVPRTLRGELVFENVTFAYPSHPDRPIVRDFNLVLNAGETIALVGPSGAGKTSVFQLVMRFYDPQAGRILLDGIDIRDFDPVALRGRIGLVPQEPVIFSADAATNIRYGRPEADDAALRAAARTAAADTFIEGLPDGYATFLGEKGVRLSGGQRQRVAIARAVLRDPSLLLLDEATSALDAESERLVQGAIETLRRNRSCLVIAHRLATVRKADRIVVLEDGAVIDQGRHDELVARGGLYSRLARLQFTDGSDGSETIAAK